jgi:hypothetical protein
MGWWTGGNFALAQRDKRQRAFVACAQHGNMKSVANLSLEYY